MNGNPPAISVVVPARIEAKEMGIKMAVLTGPGNSWSRWRPGRNSSKCGCTPKIEDKVLLCVLASRRHVTGLSPYSMETVRTTRETYQDFSGNSPWCRG